MPTDADSSRGRTPRCPRCDGFQISKPGEVVWVDDPRTARFCSCRSSGDAGSSPAVAPEAEFEKTLKNYDFSIYALIQHRGSPEQGISVLEHRIQLEEAHCRAVETARAETWREASKMLKVGTLARIIDSPVSRDVAAICTTLAEEFERRAAPKESK